MPGKLPNLVSVTTIADDGSHVMPFALGRRGPAVGDSLLGLGKPLLPFAPLYVVFVLALLVGSAAAGAKFTTGFTLGTVPLPLLAGGAFLWISARFSPGSITGIRRAVALLAAAAIVLRMTIGTPMAAPEPTCPFCP